MPEKLGFRLAQDGSIELISEEGAWPRQCLIHSSMPGKVLGPDDLPLIWTLPDGMIAIKLTHTEAVYSVQGRVIQDFNIMVCKLERIEI